MLKIKKVVPPILILLYVLLVGVMIKGTFLQENHQEENKKNKILENPFKEINQEIDWQCGNYANDALVVDGYVYFYKSLMYLGMSDYKTDLRKCGNNVIYRLTPDGTYEVFHTFEYGDAVYYDIKSKLYYYDDYFYIQIENRIYRISKDGMEEQIIYEDNGGVRSYRIFGIREHYLLIANLHEIYYLDMDKWNWKDEIQLNRMKKLIGVTYDYDDYGYYFGNMYTEFYESIIYGNGDFSMRDAILKREKNSSFSLYVTDVQEESKRVAENVYCMNVYKRQVYYAQRGENGINIKCLSLENDTENDLFEMPLDRTYDVKSLVVSDAFVICDMGMENDKYDEVYKRVIWNRDTGETQEICYK